MTAYWSGAWNPAHRIETFGPTPPEVHAHHLRLGFRSGACERCTPTYTSWHADARAGQLRPAVVGGVPIDQDPVLGDEDTGAVPFAS